MTDDDEKQKAPSAKRGLFKFLATLEPLPEQDALPEVERPPAEPFTDFDDWPDEDEAKIK